MGLDIQGRIALRLGGPRVQKQVQLPVKQQKGRRLAQAGVVGKR